jgi:hypothetical protein
LKVEGLKKKEGFNSEITENEGTEFPETEPEKAVPRRCRERSGERLVVDMLYSHPRCFLAKSAEALENKRVEICASTKTCKRVRKIMKRLGIAGGGSKQ